MDQPFRVALFGCFTCRADPPRVAPSYAQILYIPSVSCVLVLTEVILVLALKESLMTTVSPVAITVSAVNIHTLSVGIATEDRGDSRWISASF